MKKYVIGSAAEGNEIIGYCFGNIQLVLDQYNNSAKVYPRPDGYDYPYEHPQSEDDDDWMYSEWTDIPASWHTDIGYVLSHGGIVEYDEIQCHRLNRTFNTVYELSKEEYEWLERMQKVADKQEEKWFPLFGTILDHDVDELGCLHTKETDFKSKKDFENWLENQVD